MQATVDAVRPLNESGAARALRSAALGRWAQAPASSPIGRNADFMPSAAGRITRGLQLLEHPIATAEFLVVDTETNGLSGDACELTEVGAVLVGGGELHDRWSSLVGTSMPLRRGIQRFTGITQAMVDGAPRLEVVLPQLERADGLEQI